MATNHSETTFRNIFPTTSYCYWFFADHRWRETSQLIHVYYTYNNYLIKTQLVGELEC